LVVRAAFQHTLPQRLMLDPEKGAASAISRLGRAEILLVLRAQLSFGLQSNLVQHARKIVHPAHLFLRTLRVSAHRPFLLSPATHNAESFPAKTKQWPLAKAPFVITNQEISPDHSRIVYKAKAASLPGLVWGGGLRGEHNF